MNKQVKMLEQDIQNFKLESKSSQQEREKLQMEVSHMEKHRVELSEHWRQMEADFRKQMEQVATEKREVYEELKA